MRPAECEDAEATQEVEGSAALLIDQVAAFAADVEAIEPEGLEDPRQLWVEVLAMDGELLALVLAEHSSQIERHGAPS